MNVTQTLDGDLWKTVVTTACRNIPAPGAGGLPTPQAPGSPPPPIPGVTGEGQLPTPGGITEPENYVPGTYWPPGQEPWNQ